MNNLISNLLNENNLATKSIEEKYCSTWMVSAFIEKLFDYFKLFINTNKIYYHSNFLNDNKLATKSVEDKFQFLQPLLKIGWNILHYS